MAKIMEFISTETRGTSYKTFKYSFDSIGLPDINYDNDENKVMKWKESGETTKYKKAIPLKSLADAILKDDPIFSYFLDGSRRTFKVDDISYDKQVFPVIAGQIGVGCCKRINKRMKSEKFYKESIIVLPDKSYSDTWGIEQSFSKMTQNFNEQNKNNKYFFELSSILSYKTSSSNDTKLEDRGISVIQDRMVELEKSMVHELVKENKLNQDNYLLKDGSLEYKIMNKGNENLRELSKIKNNYNWVVGVSKSFNPESCKDHTGKPNSDYIANLPVYHRTPVARFENRDFLGDVQFAVWYIRLRSKDTTHTPFDGVVKVEKILMDYEIESGINSDIVDLISENIINERTPTCYGKDSRWANHLYPIYLTESFVKSKYLSTQMFLNLF